MWKVPKPNKVYKHQGICPGAYNFKYNTMPKKLTIEFIRGKFKAEGLELRTSNYTGNQQKLDFLCRCGTIGVMTWANFTQRKIKECRKCAYKRRADVLRHAVEYVTNFFLERGFRLLANEYVNDVTPMPYKCMVCNYVGQKTLQDLRTGNKGCPVCKNKSHGIKQRLTQEYVNSVFEQNDCLLLSKYTISKEPLWFFCRCGEVSLITFHHFANRRRCGNCGRNAAHAKRRRYTTQIVKNIFQNGECELLSEYLHWHEPVKYKCKCGASSEISLPNFIKGVRCNNCRMERVWDTRMWEDLDDFAGGMEVLLGQGIE